MMTRSRQLAAIMFTDIQGYTALMQVDEEQGLKTREKHRRIFNSVTKKYKGKILQYYGDGTLSIFNSAIDAAKCAIKLQQDLQKDPAIPVRIGIHSGDIIFSDEEIIGDGVNVASRIESLAVAGSVFISGKIYDEIKNQISIQTSFMKFFKLKNVESLVGVYAISNEGLVVPKPENLKSGVNPASNRNKPIRSIAVLAFENMSGDPEQEYFSDGISEEILNSLVNVDGLKVAGRTSAFSFKRQNVDIRSIGEKLNVKMVLEGSVRKAGNQVRVAAQLINVEDGYHIWSETYNREMENIFTVQEDIAKHIVQKLKLQVQKSTNGDDRTSNLEAYDLFLKGIYFRSKDFLSAKKAMECFQMAVKLDPDYSEAYALIAETYIVYAGYGLMPMAEAHSNARTAAQKAISLNEQEPRAHKALAYVYFTYDWNWEKALSEYNKAVHFGLRVPDQFITYYDIFVNKDFDHAVTISEQMVDADPLNIESHWHLGLINYFSGRFSEALVSFNNVLELDPDYSEGHHWKGTVLGYLGKYEEAIYSLKKALEITNGEGPANLDLQIVKIQMGDKKEVLQILNDWEESGQPINPMDPAMLYALLDLPDKAIYWLGESHRERSIMMASLKSSWIWDSIRNDPRFIRIYDSMNFPE